MFDVNIDSRRKTLVSLYFKLDWRSIQHVLNKYRGWIQLYAYDTD